MRQPLFANIDTNFSDKRRALGRYSSLANYGQGVQFISTGSPKEQCECQRIQVISYMNVALLQHKAVCDP
jgi:hypothetical protein